MEESVGNDNFHRHYLKVQKCRRHP